MKLWSLSLLALCAAVPSCADKPATAIVVAVQPEMPAPGEIDGIEIEVQRGSNFPFFQPYELDPSTRLPGTLTLTDDEGDPKKPVTITIRARRQGKEVVLRRSTLGFSEEKTKLLRMPLRYGCWGFADACPAGESCKAGACAPDLVDPETLPVFLMQQVFGARTSGCFDVAKCMAGGVDIPVASLSGCTIPVGEASNFNLALKWSRSTGTASTIVDEDADEGWERDGAGVRLSPGLCAAVKRGEVTRATWSAACAPKQTLQPPCQDGAPGGSVDTGSGGASGGEPPAGGSGGVTGGNPPKGGSGGTSGGSLPTGGSGGTSGGSAPKAGSGGVGPGGGASGGG